MSKTPRESLAGVAVPGSAHLQGEREVQLMDEVAALRQQVAELQAVIAAHERTEKALRNREVGKPSAGQVPLADHIISAVQNLVLVADEQGEIIFASPSVSRLLGYSPQAVLRDGWLNLLKRDNAERQGMKHYLAAAAKGEAEIITTPYETAVYDKQGKQHWILWQDAKGPGNSIIGIGSDITARKQAQEALQESEERLQRIVKATNDAVWEWDLVTNTLWWSEGIHTLFGYALEGIVPAITWWEAHIHPEDRARVMAKVHRTLASGEHLWSEEYRFRKTDGSYADVFDQGYVERDAEGKPLRAFGGMMNITARKRAEEELQDSEERYRSLFEQAYDGIACFTLDGICTSVNQELTTILGWSREEIVGQHYSKFVTPATVAHVEERVRHLRAGEKASLIYMLEAVHKDGQVVLVEGRTRFIRTATGKPLGVLGIYRDITERKRMEETLQQAKESAEAANRAKSEFLATMSHELRTPLGIILGYTDLLLEHTFGRLSKEQADSLRRIDRSARELHDLITAVLDLSRLEAGRLPLDVCETQGGGVLQEVQAETSRLQEQTPLRFVWEVEEALPVLYTDPGKLKIVLKNLIGNAVKFTPRGSILVAARYHEEGVEFRVTDTGIGIPQEALGAIFEPFRQIAHSATPQHGGTGLGLHIVKRLLEVLGGTITVESKVGHGSTFRVWIPKGESPEERKG